MYKKIMRLLAFPMFIGPFFSCQSGKIEKHPDAVPVAIIKAMDTTASVEEQPVADSNFKNFPLNFNSEDTAYAARVLTTGQFHEDEVSKEDAKRSWYGIFKNNEGYYLDSTTIQTKRVEDPVSDEGGKKTGWDVKTANNDTSLLLFSGVDGLSKRKIAPVELSKQQILPGEQVSFTYNGISYTLYATGNKKKEAGSEYYIVTNYELFLKATINGAERRQLLVASGTFDDAMVEILFAGDIDGDAIPDLIINTSNHYNATVPTLYLSKPAGSTQLLKIMGMHVSLGC
jgi:hypothetical protein